MDGMKKEEGELSTLSDAERAAALLSAAMRAVPCNCIQTSSFFLELLLVRYLFIPTEK